jgi:hypothetical protein
MTHHNQTKELITWFLTLSMHVAPPAIRIVVVPTGVIVVLGLCNSPRSWTRMVGPFLPGLTIAPYVDSLLCYRLIRRPKSILQDSPKIKGTCIHLYNYIWVVLLVPRLNLAFLSPKLSRGIDKDVLLNCRERRTWNKFVINDGLLFRANRQCIPVGSVRRLLL